MKLGYARISKADGSQKLDLQWDALKSEGIKAKHIYSDKITGAAKNRPGLAACLKALRPGDQLVVWKLDRLGRNLRHLVNLIHDLEERGIAFKVLDGKGSGIDTQTPQGKMIFNIFSALAEFERELIRERTIAGLKAARARGRLGGRRPKLSKAKLKLIQAAMGKQDTIVTELAKEMGVTRATLYRYVDPKGHLREAGKDVMGK